MNTQSHRIVSVLMIGLMVAVVAAGWFLVAQPQLAAASASNDQLASVQSQIASSQSSLDDLRKSEVKLPQLAAQLVSLQESIPGSLASSALVSGIDQQASAAGVHVNDISVDDPAPYAPPLPATPAAGATTGATPSPAPTPTATPSSTATAVPSPSKLQYVPKSDARITAANFVTVPVSITVQGTWAQTLAFVKGLQTGTRLYAVGTLSSKQKSDDATQYTTVVTGYMFSILDPASQAQVAAKKAAAKKAATTPTAAPATKSTPAASATPVPSGSPSPSVTPSR